MIRKISVSIIVFLAVFGLFAFTSSSNEKYFEIAKNLDIFATLFKEVNNFYVDDVNPNKLMKTGIDAMLESLDPYTNYIPEDEVEDYRTMTTGQYGGIGAVIGKRNNKTTVLMPYEGFPAHMAGLKIGDEILSVDAVEVIEKNTNDVSKLLKGQAGTKVKVKIKRFGINEPLELELTRQKIKIDNIPYYGMVNDEVGYIHLTDFTSNASKEVKDAIVALKEKGMKSLIFDLRDNPGGLLNEAINISNLFIPKDKEVVSTKGKAVEWNKVYTTLNQPVDIEMPLVVLVSSRSASASEIVSGTVQDYDRGVLIGQKSYGKGLVQATRPLSYNSQLKVTTAKYYIPSGRCIQALDYSHRNEDGSVGKIPDSLKTEFKTKNGRSVYDGGGVDPDILVTRKEAPAILVSLINKGYLFDYATVYASKHKTITSAKSFKISDDEYKEFIKSIEGKDYDYSTKVEKNMNELIESAKKEKYYEDIKEQIETLKNKVSHNKLSDLNKFSTEIRESLEQEIVSRYYLQKGIVESSFDNDEDVKEAIKILNDPTKYQKLLTKNTSK